MEKQLTSQQLIEYAVARAHRRKWRTVVICLAAVVVFCTVYALILPAITINSQVLACAYNVHQHDSSCYDEEGKLICGMADYVVHTHNDYCYDDGELVCGLEEIEAHEHTDECYETEYVLTCGEEENDGHVHNDACYTKEQGELICENTDKDHEHTDDCYEWTETLTCGLDQGDGEHHHSDECYAFQNVLICDKPEVILHSHTDECYEDILNDKGEIISRELKCGMLQVEEHQHTKDCLIDSSQVSLMALLEEENLDVPLSVLTELADDYGIYIGTKSTEDGSEIWTAYDTGDEETANIKATVTFPSGVTESGYYFYIKEVTKGDYYPDPSVIENAVGEYNDYRCYDIKWVYIYQDSDGNWKYEFKDLSLDAQVTIEYVNEDTSTYLQGKKGIRKLRIFSSTGTDGSTLKEDANLVGIKTTDSVYTGFTFTVKYAGAYVFVSQKVFDGYVSNLSITSVTDGSEPFDTSTDDSTGVVPGYDSSGSNGIVRSYDNVQYNLEAIFAARSNTSTEETATLYFEMTMQADLTDAYFDLSQMLWLGSNYTIDYLDKDGNVVLTQNSTAFESNTYYDTNGKTVNINSNILDSTNGEYSYTTHGTLNITTQRLTGYIVLSSENSTGNNVLAATKALSAGIQVLNAQNGTFIQPTFRAWFDGNQTNYGTESGSSNSTITSQPVTDNVLKAEAVTVSSMTSCNVKLAQNGYLTYKSWFDFDKGIELISSTTITYTTSNNVTVKGSEIYMLLESLGSLKENYGKDDPAEYTDASGVVSYPTGTSLADFNAIFAQIRYGRMTGYGLTLQMYNQASDSTTRSGKGIMGLSLPVGDVEFDLALSLTAKNSNTKVPVEDGYTAILWDYNENVYAYSNYGTRTQDDHSVTKTAVTGGTTSGINRTNSYWNRNMYWNYITSTAICANGNTPGNFRFIGTTGINNVYWGGLWNIADKDKSSPQKTSDLATNTNSVSYHLTTSGYDFDFATLGDLSFPTCGIGTTTATTGYANYIGCFSAGYIEVLTVFPREQTENATITLGVAVRNQAFSDADGNIAGDVLSSDDKLSVGVAEVVPGSINKYNSFNTLGASTLWSTASSGTFLGTDYDNQNYDASAYAGSEIALIGAFRIYSTDYRYYAYNYLQLYDSRAFSIDPTYTGYSKLSSTSSPAYRSSGSIGFQINYATGDTIGDITALYAADPDFPAGYDTNGSNYNVRTGETVVGTDMVKYMNTVRQDDLVYSTDLMTEYDSAGNITAQYILYDTDGDGAKEKLTVIGVMSEMRNCSISSDKYMQMCIPVFVNGTDTDLLNKTVCTLNAACVWGKTYGEMSGVSWADGAWNSATGKNVLSGYTSPARTITTSTYTKTEYNNGTYVPGTHNGGRWYGMSLLILSYKSEVNIEIDKEFSGLYPIYSMDDAEYNVNYHIKNIKTSVDDSTVAQVNDEMTTSLHVTDVLDKANTRTGQRMSLVTGSYNMIPTDTITLVDENGKSLDSVAISTNAEEPSVVHFKYHGKIKVYTIEVYAAPATDGSSVVFHINNAIVGNQMPDITFSAQIDQTEVSNNDTITTDVYISGSGDARAYDVANGNMDNATLGISKLYATRLVKKVDTKYIELDGDFTYTVTYTNSSITSIDTVYMYDLFPNSGDDLGSEFSGDFSITDFWVEFESSGSNLKSKLTAYYSTEPYDALAEKLDFSNDSNRNVGVINSLISKSFSELGTIDRHVNDSFTYSSAIQGLSDSERDALFQKITAVYIIITDFDADTSVSLNFTVKTDDNQVADLYRNVANTWVDENSAALTSNMVETIVISRSISGLVWFDVNPDGMQDADENPIANVTVTLFKYNEASKKYEPCTENILGDEITPIVTGEDGQYSFTQLSEGDYIVAFSGEELDDYTGVTSYQVNGSNDSTTNDGVALSELNASGIDTKRYAYAIKYSDSSDSVTLHSIEEIVSSNITLSGYMEQYANLDLGMIVTGPELPRTGGAGTELFIISGLILIAGAVGVGYGLRRRNERRIKE